MKTPIRKGEGEVVVNVPMITESVVTLQITLKPGDTANKIRKYMGISPPESLCRWPERVAFRDDDDVYDAVVNKKCGIYIRTRS